MTAIGIIAAVVAGVIAAGAWLRWAVVPVVAAYRAGLMTGQYRAAKPVFAL